MIPAAHPGGKHAARYLRGDRVTRALLVVGLTALTVLAGSVAQQPKPGPPGPPCCVITAIDLRQARVTAEESSTGHVFRFELKDKEQLRKLKVGQKVWADFAAGTVTLDPETKPCCNILKTGGTVP